MTEIYIYACQLAEHEFNVPQFQVPVPWLSAKLSSYKIILIYFVWNLQHFFFLIVLREHKRLLVEVIIEVAGYI